MERIVRLEIKLLSHKSYYWLDNIFFNEPVSQILKLERVQLYDVQVKLFFDLIFCLFFVVELIC